MSGRIPKDAYAIIIGSMKCGTSSLYGYLKNHPEICPAFTKEPEFFSEIRAKGVESDNYYLQLEQYRNYFPVENILVLDFDVLKGNPRQVLRTVYEFLNLSQEYYPEEFKVRNKTHIESELEKMLKKHKISSVFNYIPGPLKEAGKKLIRLEKRTLTMEEEELIRNKLKEDMAALHRVYGTDVKKWGF